MDSSKIFVFFLLVCAFFGVGFLTFEDQLTKSRVSAFFKILPILSLLSSVLLTDTVDALHRQQKTHFQIGLVLCLCGDVCMVWRKELLWAGVLLFLVGHLFYILSFRLTPLGIEAAVFCMTCCLAIYLYVLPDIGSTLMRVLLLLYGLFLFATWWRTIVRWQMHPSLPNLFAVIGAFVFIVSDFLIGVQEFKGRDMVPYVNVCIMVTYYIAQLLLTLAVTLCGWTYPTHPQVHAKDN